ncbi:MAG: ribulose-phosphate 3-epimerase [Eubacteriales bacterium]|nr:ribulose-phosphate 3-epimerase [Eubacteriales bacterium]
MTLPIKISPSVLSADCVAFGRDIAKIENDAQWLHYDVMDGHFVPNISYGVPVVKALTKATKLFADVHLMITDPLFYIEPFVKAGAELITFHVEADSDIQETIDRIHSFGIKCGLALKPKTSIEAVMPYLDKIDMLLQMTVEPGFGGQAMVEDAIGNLAILRKAAPNLDIQVDGGINADNIGRIAKEGANIFVAGSAVFGAEDPAMIVRLMKERAEEAIKG